MEDAVPSGMATRNASSVTHSEPQMAVEIPALSGSEDCGLVMKFQLTQLRNCRSTLPGISAASVCTWSRLKMESNNVQLSATSGFSTSASTSCSSCASLRAAN